MVAADQFDSFTGVHRILWVVDSKCESQIRYGSIRSEVSCYIENRVKKVIRGEISIRVMGKLLRMGAPWKRQENRGS